MNNPETFGSGRDTVYGWYGAMISLRRHAEAVKQKRSVKILHMFYIYAMVDKNIRIVIIC